MLSAALVVSACSGTAESSGAPPTVTETGRSPAGNDLLAGLWAGGMVVVIRHAVTGHFIPDEAEDLDDCSTQRNLTAEGRADATTIGDGFRELGIPVGVVFASPTCRTRDTAELAFGSAEVIDDLAKLFPESDTQADRRLNRLIRKRASAVGDANMVIVAHSRYPSVLPATDLEEGEAAVYALEGDGFALIGQVTPDEWADLATE